MKHIGKIILLLVLIGCTPSSICFESLCFPLEIASTPEERTQGLMFRTELEGGMLFVFDHPGRHPFWMKNTLIPLDIIWMDEDKEIVFISRNVQPCKVDPCEVIDPGADASYVLEVNAGMASDLRAGQRAN